MRAARVLRSLSVIFKNRFGRNRRAGIAVMTALSLPVIVATGGFTVDVGIWDGQQTALQAATDAAAVKAGLVVTASDWPWSSASFREAEP